MSNKMCVLVIAVAVVIFASAQCVWAADGTWNAGGYPGDNTWANSGNWVSGTIADAVDSTATFSLDVAASVPQPIDVEYMHVVGNMTFGDTIPATAGGWILNNAYVGDPNFGYLYLSVTPGTTTPPARSTITVNDLGAGAEVKINVALYGVAATDGLIKAGVGTLNLSQTNT